jgi:hypothetical protein
MHAEWIALRDNPSFRSFMVVLIPNAEIFQLVTTLGGSEDLRHVPPVHADEMDRSVDAVGSQISEDCAEKRGELGRGHFVRRHHELVAPNSPIGTLYGGSVKTICGLIGHKPR